MSWWQDLTSQISTFVTLRRGSVNADLGKDTPEATVENLAAPAMQVPRPEDDFSRGDLPVMGGRVSSPEYSTLYDLIGDVILIKNDMPNEILRTISHLVKWNADLSNALENIVALGVTKDTISFGDTVGDKEAINYAQYLTERAKVWYLGGIPSLRADLLTQAATYGAFSYELVLSPDLKGVSTIVLVDPKTIEFVYDVATATHKPYQRINNFSASLRVHPGGSNASMPGLIPLNPITYKYVAIRRHDDKPYGIPPFLAALESVRIERDMLDGFKNVIKRMGVMGFLNVLVNQPTMRPMESPMAYEQRCIEYLRRDIMPELEKGVNRGVVAGFKGAVEFDVAGNTTNVSGAKELFNLMQELKMSGLHQDPRMLGRSFSTTEEWGKVLMSKFSSQLQTYQMHLDNLIGGMYVLEMILRGTRVTSITVKSELPSVTDELVAAKVMTEKTTTGIALYNQGIFSQNDLAKYLGMDSPDSETPRVPVTAPGALSAMITGDMVEDAAHALNVDVPVYCYEAAGCECGREHHLHLTDTPPGKFEDRMSHFVNMYFNATSKVYRKGVKKMSGQVAAKLATLGEGASLQQVTDSIIYTLYTQWGTEFTARQEKIIGKWVKEIHKAFRTDPAFLEGWSKFDPANPPKSVFGVLDTRVIEYYKKSDTLYMGKFITDPDTMSRLTQYITDTYINKTLPIGRFTPQTLELFRKEFGDLLVGEEWKLRRVIDTTVNRMRNTAGLMYMGDAGVERFEVVGVRDRLQCQWCADMQGKQFTVEKSRDSIESLAKSDPADVASLSPFLVSQLKAGEVSDKTADELHALGFDTPPLHPHCRDTIVAVD